MQNISNSTESNPSVDKAIGTVILTCFLVGTTGNATALTYFWSQRRKGTANKLYVFISAADFFSSFLALPVTVSLFKNREPMLFAVYWLCGGWTILNLTLVRLSMFLVAVLSVTRTIAIVLPFRKMNWSCIVVIIAVYGAQLLMVEGTFLALRWVKAAFYKNLRSYCSYSPVEGAPSWISTFSFGKFQVEIMLPSIVVFISFIMSVVSLMKQRLRTAGNSDIASQKVTMTITLFTALFLACNVPLFGFQLLYMLIFINPTIKERFTNRVMANYAHLMFLYTPYLLNATLNPIFYLLRMPKYQELFLCKIRKVLIFLGLRDPPDEEELQLQRTRKLKLDLMSFESQHTVNRLM